MIILVANNVTARTVDLSWKHISKTKKNIGNDAYYQLSKGEIASLKFEVCYEGRSAFCVLTDLKPATKYEVKLRIGMLKEDQVVTWFDDIVAELEFTTIDDSHFEKAAHKLIKAVNDGNLDVASSVISEYRGRISLETTDKLGRTLLMIAASNGSAEIVTLLLQNGANALATTRSGKTALNKAVSDGHLRVAEILIRHDPQLIRMKDVGGSTPIMWASENSNSNKNGTQMVELLLRYGGTEIVHDVDIYNRTAFDRLCMSSGNLRTAQLLLKAGAVIRHLPTRKDLTHLMQCAINGHKELCKELIEKYSVDPKIKSSRGFTAVQLAENNGHFMVAKLIEERMSERTS